MSQDVTQELTGRVLMNDKKNYAILHVKKLHTSALGKVHAHNQRLIAVKNAQQHKQNHRWTRYKGNPPLPKIVEHKLAQYPDIRRQKNSVVAVEILLTASPEFFELKSSADLKAWADANMQWLKKKYGKNLVDVTLHLDEKTPHLHCIVLPIKMKEKIKRRTKAQIAAGFAGKKYTVPSLCVNDIYTPKTLTKLQSEYATEMKRFGLSRGRRKSGATHQTVKEYYAKTSELAVVKKEIEETSLTLKHEQIALQSVKKEVAIELTRLQKIRQDANKYIQACFKPILNAIEMASEYITPERATHIKERLDKYEGNKPAAVSLLGKENLQTIDKHTRSLRSIFKK